MERRESDYIDYRTHDGSRWRAWREGRAKFIHAPAGDRSRAHADKIINYLTIEYKGTKHWTAEWRGTGFLHYPAGRPTESHEDQIIIYLGWETAPRTEVWQAYWDAKKRLFVHHRLIPNPALTEIDKVAAAG